MYKKITNEKCKKMKIELGMTKGKKQNGNKLKQEN
jgi:hypothetical protein